MRSLSAETWRPVVTEEGMQSRPILMLTHDDLLWQHLKRVPVAHWLPARGRAWEELSRWQSQQRRLVILDAGLPGLPELDSAAWAAAAGTLDLLVATPKPNDEQGRRFLAAGAKGYIHAYLSLEGIDTALKVIANGGVWMGASLLSRLLQQLSRTSAQPQADPAGWTTKLTPRERDVAQRAALGMANQAIADELGITERTVRAHISSVFEKLGVSDRLMLALLVHGIT